MPDFTSYGAFRFNLVMRILDEKLVPYQVADELQSRRQQFPEIQRSEVESYRAMGTEWDYYPGSRDYITYGSLKKHVAAAPVEFEPVLEKRYENLRPNFAEMGKDFDISERWFESPAGKAAMRLWAGRG